jgi:hypothetical protein
MTSANGSLEVVLFALTASFLFFLTPTSYADEGGLEITEAFAAYIDMNNNGAPDDDEALIVIQGYQLCDVEANSIQIVSLGTVNPVHSLPVLDCLALFDPDRNLDKIVALLPLGLDPGSYNLVVNNSVKRQHSQKSDESSNNTKFVPENEYVGRFVFAYGS